MSTFDSHANFISSTISVPPAYPASPNATGSLTVAAGTGALFPAPPFNCAIYPAGVFPNSLNTELVRITVINGDIFTITRGAENSNVRNIQVGDIISLTVTSKCLTDIETAVNASVPSSSLGNLSELTSSVLTIIGGTNAVLGNVTIGVKKSSNVQAGYLSAADWMLFNAKQSALSLGDLTESNSSVLTITGGTGAVVGGTSITVKQSSSSQSGYLSSSDWAAFNAKQAALGYTPVNVASAGSVYLAPSGNISNTIITVNSYSSAHTLTSSDYLALVSGNTVITLPTAVGISGRTYSIKKTDSSGTTITIATTNNQIIEGLETRTLTFQYQSLTLVSNGSNWYILANPLSSDVISSTSPLQIVVYTDDPNSESVAPPDTAKAALAYSADGTKSIYGWSTSTQTWV